MEIKDAAAEMLKLVINAPSWVETKDTQRNGLTRLHVAMLLRKIMDGAVIGEKAHRWLGWAQAAHVMCGGGTLEQMKNVNHNA